MSDNVATLVPMAYESVACNQPFRIKIFSAQVFTLLFDPSNLKIYDGEKCYDRCKKSFKLSSIEPF